MSDCEKRKIVLASSSPRRRELLGRLMIEFDICSPDIDETILAGEEPQAYVQRLAAEKARVAMDKLSDKNTVIIAADTIVYFNGQILGKPLSAAHAEEMLNSMSDATHVVYTGLFVGSAAERKLNQCLCVATEVDFKNLSKVDVQTYVATGDPMDKAGAYGIQGEGGRLVKEIRGSLTNVMGLPLDEVKEILSRDFRVKVF